MTAVRGNVVFVGAEATAWFVVPGVRWAFRDDASRDAQVVAGAQRFAELTGRTVHIRVTNRPWSAEQWRTAMDGTAVAPSPTWSAHLDAEAAHLSKLALSDKSVFLGVDVSRPLAGVARLLGSFGAAHEDAKLAERLDEIARIVAGEGLDARPCTRTELAWLIDRSVALGCPSPAPRPDVGVDWEKDDIAEFSDRAEWAMRRRYGRTVQVVANVGDELVTRHVCVLTVGRMAPLDSESPWLSVIDSLGFPVEVAVTAKIQPDQAVTKRIESSIARIGFQKKHYRDFDRPAPRALERATEHALTIQDEIDRGMSGLSTRALVWIRFLVSGATEAEAVERGRRVIAVYSPKITVERTFDQHALAREAIPGESLSTVSYRREMAVTTLAGAMPQVTHHVGNRSGFYVGFTSQGSARNAVLVDQWHSMEVAEGSGLTVLAGGLGSGKSSMLGSMAVRSALSGVKCVVLDPSGPLAALTRLPELAAISRHVDVLNSKAGSLNPFQVVAEPRIEHYDTRAGWEHACTMAAGQRRSLCCDVLGQFLPAVIADLPETLIALKQATRTVGGYSVSTPRQVISALSEMGGHAKLLSELLSDVADTSAGQLVFPYGTEVDAERWDDNVGLTVITMRGLQLPAAGTPRSEWSQEEQLGMPLLGLAAWLTHRMIYDSQSMSSRKFMAMDEAWSITRNSSGRMLVNVSARETRKWNTRLWLASQNVSDLVGSEVSNLVDSAFIGKTRDPVAQTAALKLIGVPTGVGYEHALGTLGDIGRDADGRSIGREMVYADGTGAVERITVDMRGLSPAIRAALDTTPSTRARPALVA